jgi:hypothetical protein
MIAAVRGYQVALSPLFRGCCRFEPSCSEYMIGALRTHGAVKGLLIGIGRLLRCHPFGAHGYDPVPPPGRWSNGLGRDSKAKEISA